MSKSREEWSAFFGECIQSSEVGGFSPPFTLMVGPKEAKEIREFFGSGAMIPTDPFTDVASVPGRTLLMIYLGRLYIYEVQ